MARQREGGVGKEAGTRTLLLRAQEGFHLADVYLQKGCV